MNKNRDQQVTGDMLVKYYEFNKQKKEIELEMNKLKETFHLYFDKQFGKDLQGEISIDGYKLQRQVRKTVKFLEEPTVQKLEDLQMVDLVQVVKKPDEEKIKAAIQLGLIQEADLDDCKKTTISPAISVKPVTPR